MRWKNPKEFFCQPIQGRKEICFLLEFLFLRVSWSQWTELQRLQKQATCLPSPQVLQTYGRVGTLWSWKEDDGWYPQGSTLRMVPRWVQRADASLNFLTLSEPWSPPFPFALRPANHVLGSAFNRICYLSLFSPLPALTLFSAPCCALSLARKKRRVSVMVV